MPRYTGVTAGTSDRDEGVGEATPDAGTGSWARGHSAGRNARRGPACQSRVLAIAGERHTSGRPDQDSGGNVRRPWPASACGRHLGRRAQRRRLALCGLMPTGIVTLVAPVLGLPIGAACVAESPCRSRGHARLAPTPRAGSRSSSPAGGPGATHAVLAPRDTSPRREFVPDITSVRTAQYSHQHEYICQYTDKVVRRVREPAQRVQHPHGSATPLTIQLVRRRKRAPSAGGGLGASQRA